MVGHTVLFVYYSTEESKSKSGFEASVKDTHQNESFSEIPILYSEAEKMWKKVNEDAFGLALQSLKNRAKSPNSPNG